MKTQTGSTKLLATANFVRHNFNKSLLVIGILSLFVVISAVNPISGQGQGGGTDKEVVVVNTASSPVPVIAQGTTTVAGSVSVANTPSVNIVSGASIGIDSSNNTVKLDPATLVSETTLLVNQATNVDGGQSVRLGPVDVSMFKQIRVVVVREFSTGNCGVEIIPYLRYGEAPTQRSPIHEPKVNDLNEVYELPGRSIEVSLRGLGPANTCGDLVRIVVYGRT